MQLGKKKSMELLPKRQKQWRGGGWGGGGGGGRGFAHDHMITVLVFEVRRFEDHVVLGAFVFMVIFSPRPQHAGDIWIVTGHFRFVLEETPHVNMTCLS